MRPREHNFELERRMAHWTTHCRSCGCDDVVDVLDLGTSPLANSLPLTAEQSHAMERHPLVVCMCRGCALAQLRCVIPPEVVFDEAYPYHSSTSAAFCKHAKRSAESIIDRLGLGPKHLALEVASNDGYMLRHFAERGVRVRGVDAAPGPCAVARARGVPTIEGFFDRAMGADFAQRGERADVIIANNVIAHVPAIDDFFAGLAAALADNGELVMEFPYLADLVDRGAFDTIYHEHVFYHSVSSVSALLRRHGLGATHVERIDVHGGSLRLCARHEGEPDDSVRRLLNDERERGLTTPAGLATLRENVDLIRRSLSDVLRELRDRGLRIAGYGAAAKAVTLLHALEFDLREIEFIADLAPSKQGRFVPGTPIPITPPAMIEQQRPDILVVFAWNFADEIMRQQRRHAETGGRFLIPMPCVRLI